MPEPSHPHTTALIRTVRSELGFKLSVHPNGLYMLRCPRCDYDHWIQVAPGGSDPPPSILELALTDIRKHAAAHDEVK